MATKTTRKTRQLRETAVAYMMPPIPLAPTKTYQTSITSKGQVVIPAALRRKLGITPKTRLVISEEDEKIIIKPINPYELIERLRGSLAGGPSLTKALLEERAKDREREDAKFNRSG